MKRFLSVLVSVTMVFIFSTSVFADSVSNYDDYKEKAEFVKNNGSEIRNNKTLMENGQDIDESEVLETDKSESLQLELVRTEKFEVDGIEFEEYYYKKSKMSRTFSTRIIRPEEGDFKIVIAKGELSGKDWFDSKTGYYMYLQSEATYKMGHYLAYLISDTILGFFAFEAQDLIQEGLKGSGSAYSLERRVYKWGQIYHNNEWVDYYRGHQDEVFWGHKTIVYGNEPDNYGTAIYTKDVDYLDGGGYNPIMINATKIFRDNDKVYEYSLMQYQSNAYFYGDTGSVVRDTPHWKIGIDPMYR